MGAARGLLGAIQFLTRIPIRLGAAVDHDRVVPWFPIVGVLIGAVVGGIAVGLGEFVPRTVAAAVAVAAGMLVTGAFHEDGLADIADAFGGGWTIQERFEILKDSRHGTYGVAALCGSIVIRVVAAGSIPSPAALFTGFVAAHTLGRAGAVVAMLVAPPATDSGLGASSARELRPAPTVLGLLVAAGIVTALTGWWAGVLVMVSVTATAVVVFLALAKIGGIAGDVLGAVEQVCEGAVLVAVSGLAAHTVIWWG